MQFDGLRIGFALTGSHCTLNEITEVIKYLVDQGADVTPIVSFSVESMDTRFGTASDWKRMVTEITEKLRKFFESRQEVQFAVLFGSLAKGTPSILSDVDVAVMVAPQFRDTSPYGYQAGLTADLMGELKRNDVDVIILNKAPILLKYQILRYGKFIHIRDKQARIQFQIDTINQYEDFKAMYRVHEEACHRRWEELIDSEMQ